MNLIKLWSIHKPKWSIEVTLLLGFISLAVLILLIYLSKRRKWNRLRVFAVYVLTIYLVLIFASTVFTRPVAKKCRYRLEFFWSYKWGIKERGNALIIGILLNILMFVPCGILLPPIYKIKKLEFVNTILTGMLISCCIEVLQLILRRGLFEFDDIIHNTIGCAVGYGGYKIISKIKLLE